jgi:glycosyltransferase involved in cell wall biosynthesis
MSDPARILYEIHPHTLGGTEHFLARFLPLLDRKSYQPVIIAQHRGAPLQLIRSLGFETAAFRDYFSPSGIQRIADFIRKSDIQLVQSNYYAANLAMAANLAGVPHIWRLGGHVEVGSGVRTARQTRWALNIIRMLSKVIICNSKYVRSQFLGRSNKPPVQVIQNGIPVNAHTKSANGKTPFVIGMVAHFTPQKRHIDFIRAARIVLRERQDVSFVMFGQSYAQTASRNYAKRVAQWAEPLQRRGRMRISSSVSANSNQVAELDLTVLPSIGESFSNAILESMAAGVPVIAARSGGHPELIQHQRTGLLARPEDPEDLAAAILYLLNRPKLIHQMSEASVQRVRRVFSMQKCVSQYEQVYRSTIEKGVTRG